MEKQKRWHFFLIVTAIILTVYNILPTVFYYAQPLKKSIDEKKALTIAESIETRVNLLEQDALTWTQSFCKLINLKPLSTTLDKDNFALIHVNFKTLEEAHKFRTLFPQAGASIEFLPSQLSLYEDNGQSKTVIIQRRIPIRFNTKKINHDFQFGTKRDAAGQLTDLYRSLVQDRVIQIGTTIAGTSENGLYAQASLSNLNEVEDQEMLMIVAQILLIL